MDTKRAKRPRNAVLLPHLASLPPTFSHYTTLHTHARTHAVFKNALARNERKDPTTATTAWRGTLVGVDGDRRRRLGRQVRARCEVPRDCGISSPTCTYLPAPIATTTRDRYGRSAADTRLTANLLSRVQRVTQIRDPDSLGPPIFPARCQSVVAPEAADCLAVISPLLIHTRGGDQLS